MPVSEIFSIILMGAASVLCIALIFFLNKITRSVVNIEENLSGISREIFPVIQNITAMTEKINVVAEELKEPITDVVDIIDEIKDRINLIFDFEEKLRTNISSGVTGVVNGIKTFWNTYKQNGNEPGRTYVIRQ